MVLMYYSKFLQHPSKLYMHWLRPFIIQEVTELGATKLQTLQGQSHYTNKMKRFAIVSRAPQRHDMIFYITILFQRLSLFYKVIMYSSNTWHLE